VAYTFENDAYLELAVEIAKIYNVGDKVDRVGFLSFLEFLVEERTELKEGTRKAINRLVTENGYSGPYANAAWKYMRDKINRLTRDVKFFQLTKKTFQIHSQSCKLEFVDLAADTVKNGLVPRIEQAARLGSAVETGNFPAQLAIAHPNENKLRIKARLRVANKAAAEILRIRAGVLAEYEAIDADTYDVLGVAPPEQSPHAEPSMDLLVEFLS
jgi:hypothetical protein